MVLELTGCKGDSASAAATQEVVAENGKLSASQEALLARRDTLLSSRRKLKQEREALAEERARVLATGGDTSEVDKKADELKQEEQQLGAEEDRLNHDFEELLTAQRAVLASIASAGGETAQIAAREATLAGREKTVAARESRLAERERELATREQGLAERERTTCGAARAPVIIQQAPPPSGATYSKRDVESLLERARRYMSKKGILPSDLPAPVQGLEREATKAMGKGDYASARFAASQLMTTVDATKIDRAFIQAKIALLSSTVKGTTLADDVRKKVDDLFREATTYYGDGKFSSANQRLNKIYALLGT